MHQDFIIFKTAPVHSFEDDKASHIKVKTEVSGREVKANAASSLSAQPQNLGINKAEVSELKIIKSGQVHMRIAN